MNVPRASDFRTIRVQASWFTPTLQIRPTKALAYLLTKHGDVFDGEPVTFPGVPNLQESPVVVMPQLFLNSADGKHRLVANQSRLDMFREEGDSVSDELVTAFFGWAADLALGYLDAMQAKAGRVACYLTRVFKDEDPGMTLKRHFCQQRWVEGPMKRNGDFELHVQERIKLGDLFEINSWVRSKTATLIPRGGERTGVILVEQELNSLAEQMDVRSLAPEEIREFSRLAPWTLGQVLEQYYPNA
jgi:hypothetical protein